MLRKKMKKMASICNLILGTYFMRISIREVAPLSLGYNKDLRIQTKRSLA